MEYKKPEGKKYNENYKKRNKKFWSRFLRPKALKSLLFSAL